MLDAKLIKRLPGHLIEHTEAKRRCEFGGLWYLDTQAAVGYAKCFAAAHTML